MDVGYVGHPNLVNAIYCPVFDQVGINHKVVLAVGGADPFVLARPTAPALLVHDPGNFLVIDDPTCTLQSTTFRAIG